MSAIVRENAEFVEKLLAKLVGQIFAYRKEILWLARN